MVVATPLFAKVGEVMEMTPGDEESPVLAEMIDFEYLIPADSPFFDAFINTNRVNILLLGVDNHNLTDTILLVSFDVDNKFIDVISIPRDTYYYRGPGYIDDAHHKINAIWRKNALNTAIAVSEILENIPINYYAEVSYKGVENIIEAIGGVPMNIERPMRYSDPRDTPPLNINIPAGQQTLNGKKSVEYLRYRGYREGDLGRVKAQQEFFKSAARQCLSLDLPKIISTAFENVNSDISIGTALYLGRKVVGIDPENIRTHQMPGSLRDPFVMPDKTAIAEMLIEIYSMEPFEFEVEEGENGNEE
jgi:LCP family protein required for cell wall assembly